MNLQAVLAELDGYFQRREIDKVEPFILARLSEADAAGDKPARLTLLNELMGFYRGMSRFGEALAIGREALALMEQLGYKGSVPYATTLLNVATALRAKGDTREAIALFEETGRLLAAHDVRDPWLLASLHNNLSLAYQEADEHAQAIASLGRALELVQQLPESAVHVAVTLTNRAQSSLRLGHVDTARDDLVEALRLFESQPHLNSHYGAALAALGEVAWRSGDMPQAAARYEHALREIESHYGRNLYYAVTLESFALVLADSDAPRSHALREEAQRLQAALK